MAGFGRLMRPLDVIRGLSVLTCRGTTMVPLLVLILTYDHLYTVPSSLHHLKIRLLKDCKNIKGCLHSMVIVDVV